MPVIVDVQGRDVSVKKQRLRWANRVLEHFDGKLPELRLLIFMDDRDAESVVGKARGLFHPMSKNHYDATAWPRTLALALRTINPIGPEPTFHYDGVIYLPNRTCTKQASLTMTLAHELQHCIQYAFNQSVWALNTVPMNIEDRTLTGLGLKWRDIPIEYEARVIAKRISQAVLGVKRTSAYIEARIKEKVSERDVDDWLFIRDLDTSWVLTYDCDARTKELFQRLAPLRQGLQEALENASSLPEFANLKLADMIKD